MSLQDYNVNVLVSFHHARDTDAILASAATICSTVELIRLFQLQVHQFCSGHTPLYFTLGLLRSGSGCAPSALRQQGCTSTGPGPASAGSLLRPCLRGL